MTLKELYAKADYKDRLGMCFKGDCLELMKDIPDGSIDMIVTDPPYPTTSRGNAGNSGGMLQKDINRKGKVFTHNDVNIREYACELYRLLKESTHCYVMVNNKNLIEMLNSFTQDMRTPHEKQIKKKPYSFHFIKSLIWNKGNKIMGTKYMSQYEYVLFFSKGKSKNINHCGTSDIIPIYNRKTKDENGNNIHDTEKPVELMECLIENSSNNGDIILDPFMGSGTTAIACKNTNRKYIGIELDDKYFDIACERLRKVE